MILSEEHDKVLPAFVETLGEIGSVTRAHTADAGTYTYSYANLSDTLAEVKRACAEHFLVVSQNMGHESDEHGDYLTVTTTVLHPSGQWITWPPARCKIAADPQKMGSASTYLRRYSLTALFAIPTTDDDGSSTVRGIRDEAAEQATRASEAGRVFDLVKNGTDTQKHAVKALADDRGLKVTKAALLDDGWRADVVELLEFTDESDPS